LGSKGRCELHGRVRNDHAPGNRSIGAVLNELGGAAIAGYEPGPRTSNGKTGMVETFVRSHPPSQPQLPSRDNGNRIDQRSGRRPSHDRLCVLEEAGITRLVSSDLRGCKKAPFRQYRKDPTLRCRYCSDVVTIRRKSTDTPLPPEDEQGIRAAHEK
jgi:hypothetical protein